MPKRSGEHTETIEITSSDQTWTFTRNFSVHDSNYTGIDVAAGADNNTLVLHGIVKSNAGFSGIEIQADNTRLEIKEDGRIRGDGSAFDSGGDGTQIINEGLIKGASNYTAGYLSGANSEFRNSGTVVGQLDIRGENSLLVNKGVLKSNNNFDVIAMHGDNSELRNFGTIAGGIDARGDKALLVNEKGGSISDDDGAVSFGGFETDGAKFINHGKVAVLINPESSYAVSATDFGDTLINDGKIVGSVSLRDGNDTVDNRGGKITGQISTYLGDDTLITDKASDKLAEAAGQGIDLVKSTVTYTLNENVERLTLLGNKDIDAKGNSDGYNDLQGNSGDNTLAGYGGSDLLDGRAGNDVLKGGTGEDFFRFATGHDKDTIHDFEQGVDHIDISDWTAIASFTEVREHAKNHGDDVRITAGDDTLVIRGLHKADLNATDFNF